MEFEGPPFFVSHTENTQASVGTREKGSNAILIVSEFLVMKFTAECSKLAMNVGKLCAGCSFLEFALCFRM